MRRRDFITLVGGAVAWPLAARAQQSERGRRLGVLVGNDENDPFTKSTLSAFTRGLQDLGWTDGRNLRIDVRLAAGRIDQMRTVAKQLVNLQPDVILADTTPVTAALWQETRTIPIVFVNVADPVGSGFVAALPHPGGFTFTEAPMGGKWLELLTEIAPAVKGAAMMFNPDTAPGGGSYFLPQFEAAARSLKVEAIAAPVHNDAEIDIVMTSLGREPGSGLVVMPDGGFTFVHRAHIILLAARNNVPAVHPDSVRARDGGLLSYGPDQVDIFRRSASYVDLILRGAMPEDLPVQLPIKFEMAINLKTVKALGLTVPPSILLRADEVIE
jgi:putative tryptophan/tyrosine transport system substrate-binding protein